MSTTDTTATAEVAPLVIKISEVKALLDQGKSRKEIAEHFGKTQTEMKLLVWSSPKLKNLKAKKQYTGIQLEDDVEDEPTAEAEQAPVAEAAEIQAGAPDTTADPVKEEEQAPATEEAEQASEEAPEAVTAPASNW